jgi:plastocyanin
LKNDCIDGTIFAIKVFINYICKNFIHYHHMKKQLLLLAALVGFTFSSYAGNVIITNSGNTFTPDTVQITLGDTVIFNISASHNAREVSQATWMANGNTALSGGFETPFGGDTIVPTSVGEMYYVCSPHASMGMKGYIKVVANTAGIDDAKSITMQIMQSVADQYLKLVVTNGSTGAMKVEMLNLSGQVVKTVDMQLSGDESTSYIQVGDMPKGVYMIRWSYGSTHKAKKIILQ